MKLKTFLLLLCLLAGLPAALAEGQGYAILKGDTLRIGNHAIERTFLWNNGALKTIRLVNKLSHVTIHARGDQPDFAMVKTDVDSAFIKSEWKHSDGVHAPHTLVSVWCRQGGFQSLRQFRIYDDCPAIGCDIFVCGSMEALSAADNTANADRKNIESVSDMTTQIKTPTIDRLRLNGNHWRTRVVEFFDYTDWNDNLVALREFYPYRRTGYRGNLLFARNELSGAGFFLLKEAPSSSTQLCYTGADFVCDFADFMVVSPGVLASDITPTEWTRVYGCVVGLWHQTELSALTALRSYQKQLRRDASARDEMIMLNTWGDRSQDAKINEDFCMAELDRAKRLGITVFQLDDGWQTGKSPNSKMPGGSFKDIWKDSLYWTPDKRKFPHGLKPIVHKARKLGIRIGLWFNPSIQNDFADWQKDADAVIRLYREYGICCFKIDGLQIPTKRAETNLRCLFERISAETDHQVIFNLDATAGRRGGYHMLNEYGNIFLENRYTDWGNYYPYRTLRNLWQLCRYVPAEKLQIEFLNKWRNRSEYRDDDSFSPANYGFDYLFATAMAAQPLAWMEAANLPEEAFAISTLINSYRAIQHDFHRGIILPIGDEPSGRSWTGFQSITDSLSGYFIVYREDNDASSESLRTFLPDGVEVNVKLIAGNGASFVSTTSDEGRLRFRLPQKNQFSIYKYIITK
ncbi:MAG: alpha-galactosidase [Prevotella sp.]|nr:alpha-galactosidase [Prevotella sp.]